MKTGNTLSYKAQLKLAERVINKEMTLDEARKFINNNNTYNKWYKDVYLPMLDMVTNYSLGRFYIAKTLSKSTFLCACNYFNLFVKKYNEVLHNIDYTFDHGKTYKTRMKSYLDKYSSTIKELENIRGINQDLYATIGDKFARLTTSIYAVTTFSAEVYKSRYPNEDFTELNKALKDIETNGYNTFRLSYELSQIKNSQYAAISNALADTLCNILSI